MFRVGDLVIYGRTGICEVVDVTTMDMAGVPKDKLYYILMPRQNKSGKIFTPVENGKVILRAVISKEEAESLIDCIPEIDVLWIANERMREASYKECLRNARCEDYVRIIKTLYIRKQERLAMGKRITATDEKYLKLAESSLYSELSLVLGIPESEMESYLIEKIEQKSRQ